MNIPKFGKIPGILAFLLIAGYFAAFGLLVFVDTPERATEVLNIMVGTLGTLLTAAATYHFARDKDDEI